MYKNLDAQYYKKILHLSPDYKVEGFLSYGGYGPNTHLKRLRGILKSMGIKYQIKKLSDFLENIIEIKINKKIYWFSVIYGGAVLSEYIHFACIFGAKKNIHIGSCGGLNKNINSADLIIPTSSYGNESTTKMYQRKNTKNIYLPNKNLSKRIGGKINKVFSVHKGSIISIQAMLAETKKDIQEWSKAGYSGVEMETAIVFAVSNHFKTPSASLLYVSDNLIKGQTAGDKKHIQEKNLREKSKKEIYRVALLELLEI